MGNMLVLDLSHSSQLHLLLWCTLDSPDSPISRLVTKQSCGMKMEGLTILSVGFNCYGNEYCSSHLASTTDRGRGEGVRFFYRRGQKETTNNAKISDQTRNVVDKANPRTPGVAFAEGYRKDMHVLGRG